MFYVSGVSTYTSSLYHGPYSGVRDSVYPVTVGVVGTRRTMLRGIRWTVCDQQNIGTVLKNRVQPEKQLMLEVLKKGN